MRAPENGGMVRALETRCFLLVEQLLHLRLRKVVTPCFAQAFGAAGT